MGCVTVIARGIEFRVAPSHTCDRVPPQETTFIVAVGGADAGDTSIPVAAAVGITRTILAPFFIKFVDAAGNEDFVKVTADYAPAATTLTVDAIPRDIAAAATAEWPPILAARESADMTPDNVMVDINVFENDGNKDSQKTQSAINLAANGFYSPIDPGWRTVAYADEFFEDVWMSVQLPNPENDLYVSGELVSGFWGVEGVPISAGSTTEIIKSNFSFKSRGPITRVYPVAV
jgi:hypothetical protein